MAKRPDHLVEQLRSRIAPADGAARPTDPEEPDLLWARRLLAGDLRPPPAELRSPLIEALVAQLVAETAVDRLQWLAGLPQRAVAKAARTGLHRLRSRRVDAKLPARAVTARGTGQPVGSSSLPCLVTLYDGHGERLVWIAQPDADGTTVVQARLSVRHGLIELHHGQLTRRNYRQMARELGDRVPNATVEQAVAGWFVHEGARICEQQQRDPPVAYRQHRRDLPGGEHPGHPALTLSPAEVDTRTLLQLYTLDEMQSFLPEPDALQRLALRLQEVASSRLFVDEGQRRRQQQHTLTQWLDDYFSEIRLAAARRWLLDTAHFFATLSRSPQDCHLRTAADLFTLPRAQLLAHPFVLHFAERLFDSRPSASPVDSANETSSGGLIIP